jgi:hypothetical protein
VYPYEYDLVLQPDINTRGHTQWYYFSVRNMRAGQAYTFNIINLQKPDSLYNMGMLPLLHSEQQMRCKVRRDRCCTEPGAAVVLLRCVCCCDSTDSMQLRAHATHSCAMSFCKGSTGRAVNNPPAPASLT